VVRALPREVDPVSGRTRERIDLTLGAIALVLLFILVFILLPAGVPPPVVP